MMLLLNPRRRDPRIRLAPLVVAMRNQPTMIHSAEIDLAIERYLEIIF
jgi:hypothetical protein